MKYRSSSRNSERYCIYGSGGHAREVAGLLSYEIGGSPVVGFVDDFANGRSLRNLPVVDFDSAVSRYGDIPWLVAVGSPRDRKRLSEKVLSHHIFLGSYISTRAYVSTESTIGDAVQIFPNSVVSDGVEIGYGCIINYNSTISHDCVLGSWVTISPGANIAGFVNIEECAFVGIGACVLPGKSGDPMRIGNNVVVGGGALVTKSVAHDGIVVGNPARPLSAQK